MSSTENIKRKKEYAKLLYTTQGVTVGKELAQRTGVSAVTISKWINKEGWEDLRASAIITKEQQIRRFYAQVVELNDAIEKREQGFRYASSSEADTLIKITKAINELETETSIAEALEVITNLVIHTREHDYEKTKILIELGDSYIKSLM